MKSFSIILLTALVAIVASYVTVKSVAPQNTTIVAQEDKRETAYERVMRTKTIRCGYFVWEPAVMKDPNTNEFSGINYEIMQKIGEKLGMEVEWTTDVDMAGMVDGLRSGKFDVMCATSWPNAGLIQNVTMTDPEFYTPVFGVVRQDDARFDNDIQKANDPSVRVSGIDSDITADLAREFLPKATTAFLPQTGNGSEMLLQIMTNKADIAFVDEGLINNFVKHNPNSLRKVAGVSAMRVFGERMMVDRHEFELKQMLDLSIEQLVNDGIIQGILDKYMKSFGTVVYPPNEAYKR